MACSLARSLQTEFPTFVSPNDKVNQSRGAAKRSTRYRTLLSCHGPTKVRNFEPKLIPAELLPLRSDAVKNYIFIHKNAVGNDKILMEEKIFRTRRLSGAFAAFFHSLSALFRALAPIRILPKLCNRICFAISSHNRHAPPRLFILPTATATKSLRGSHALCRHRFKISSSG